MNIISGNNNILLGTSALPVPGGDHQIVLGGAPDTVFMGGGTVGGARASAGALTLRGSAALSIGGQVGTAGQVLTSGGAAAPPYWGGAPALTLAANPDSLLRPQLAPAYFIRGVSTWVLELPPAAASAGASTWIKNCAGAGAVGNAVVAQSGAPATRVAMLPGDAAFVVCDGASWRVVVASRLLAAVQILPAITTVTYGAAPAAGGGSFRIAGHNFTGASFVLVARRPASFSVVSDGLIDAVAPAIAPPPAAPCEVSVVTPGGTAASTYVYDRAPVIASVNPAGGAAGVPVEVFGYNFDLAGLTVTVGGQAAAVTAATATRISLVVPGAPSGSAPLIVATSAGVATTAYAYEGAPEVASVVPRAGDRLTTVVVTGANLTGAAVAFGGVLGTVLSVSATLLRVTPPVEPSRGALVAITVTSSSGVAAAGEFAYAAPPEVTDVTPPAGPLAGGGPVVISGRRLEGATAVYFGAVEAAIVATADKITVTAPAGNLGPCAVVVHKAGGVSPPLDAARYTFEAAPVINSVWPENCALAGGPVTLTGQFFFASNVFVYFGTSQSFQSVPGAVSADGTAVAAVAPPAAAGAVSVWVVAGGGTSAFAPFAYVAAPTISAVTPGGGAAQAGSPITIIGTNFVGATVTVTVGGAPATSATIAETSITATAPAGAERADVVVTAVGGSATAVGAWRFNPALNPVGLRWSSYRPYNNAMFGRLWWPSPGGDIDYFTVTAVVIGFDGTNLGTRTVRMPGTGSWWLGLEPAVPEASKAAFNLLVTENYYTGVYAVPVVFTVTPYDSAGIAGIPATESIQFITNNQYSPIFW